MKYTTEIVLDLPRTQVINLFEDPHHFPAWQPGLEKAEPLEDQPGQPGAKMRLVYRQAMGARSR